MNDIHFCRPVFAQLCILSMVLLIFAFVPFSEIPFSIPEEICDNAIDDDFDGQIDLNDSDCTCELMEIVSLIPNPDFEEMDCCPSDRSQLDCASFWSQASEPTTDYLHTCGWMGWTEFPPPLPFPSGEGAMGFRDGRVLNNGVTDPHWKEYAGACLNETMVPDSTYLMNFELGFVSEFRSPPINISFYGATDCSALPFGVGILDFGCPTNSPDWIRLGDAPVYGGSGQKWVNVSIEVTPSQNINAIAIGPDCPLSQADFSTYYFFDNLLLADVDAFDLQVFESTHPCQDDFGISVRENPAFTYQWYKDGIALIGETTFELTQLYGPGNYQVKIEDGQSCRLSAPFAFSIPEFSSSFSAFICENQGYEFGGELYGEAGMYVDTLKNENNCDSIVWLNLEIRDYVEDSLVVNLFEGETYSIAGQELSEEGTTTFTFTSAIGCDSLLYLRLDYYNIYIPNVFSPNLDGANDIFQAYDEDGLIEKTDLLIYNRWGGLVYQGPAWDGRYQDKFVNPGVFIYAANLTMSNGTIRQFSGSVTVLR